MASFGFVLSYRLIDASLDVSRVVAEKPQLMGSFNQLIRDHDLLSQGIYPIL